MTQMTEKWTEGLVRAPPCGRLQSSPRALPPSSHLQKPTHTCSQQASAPARHHLTCQSRPGCHVAPPLLCLSPAETQGAEAELCRQQRFPRQRQPPRFGAAEHLTSHLARRRFGGPSRWSKCWPPPPQPSPPNLPLILHPVDPVTAPPPPVHRPVTGSSIRGHTWDLPSPVSLAVRPLEAEQTRFLPSPLRSFFLPLSVFRPLVHKVSSHS